MSRLLVVRPINSDGFYPIIRAMWTFKSTRRPRSQGVIITKHKVHLSTEQKQELVDMLKKGSSTARTIRRAHRLLMASEGKTDKIISETLKISITTVEKTSP